MFKVHLCEKHFQEGPIFCLARTFTMIHSQRLVYHFNGFNVLLVLAGLLPRTIRWCDATMPLSQYGPWTMHINCMIDFYINDVQVYREYSKTNSISRKAVGDPTEIRGLIELAQSCGTHRHQTEQYCSTNTCLLRAQGATLPVWHPGSATH